MSATQPITPLTMAILLALAQDEMHGYALMQEVEALTEGAVVPGTGSLYAALARLEDEGLVEPVADQPDEAADGRRRYFRITKQGRRAARAEAERMQRVVETARAKSLLPELRPLKRSP